MDIMRLLTRKLKSQSLEAEEEQELEEQNEEEVEEKEEETGAEGRRTFPEQRRNNDTMQATEFDSGTASDEDVTEFEEAPHCLHGIEAELHCQVVEETQQMDRPTMDPECFSSQPNATSKSSSNVISPQHVVSSVMMMTMPPASTKDSGISSSSSSRQSGPAAALSLASGRLSAVSSDFEWCSLDFEPASSSSCSSEMDQHSSEEELVSIYHRHHEQKRKHSQMSSPNDDNQCTSGEEDEDAEEEQNDEENVEERFHRDCDHHRPLSSSNCLHGNNRCLHGNHRCLHGNVGIPISAASDFASPRKRHRQTTTTSINSTAIQQQQQQQRPSLDLYKMQKTSITRKHNNGGCSNIASTNCRPRVVKIRTITGSSRPAKSSAYNPSVFSFRSISWASSRLKEEPFRAF